MFDKLPFASMQTEFNRLESADRAYHQERRASIYNSLYAAVMGLVPDVRNHPGYDDLIVTHECDRTEEIASAPLAVAWLNAQHGLVQS